MSQVKNKYKIPESINVTLMDSPVSLRQGSAGLKKPVTLFVLMIGLVAVIFYVWMVMQLFKNDFGMISIVMVSIGYFWLLSLALTRQKTGLMGYRWFMPTLKYWMDYKNRYIITRGTAEENEIMKLKWEIPIESYDDVTGKIWFTDGTVGVVFDIIGNGSRALFTGDRDEIIDAYASFLRQLQMGTTIIIDSKQSNQNVEEQLYNLNEMRRQTRNPIVEEIITRQSNLLENHIASKFKTTTQHIMFRSRNEETLSNDIQQMKQYGVTLFRYAEIITNEALEDYLKKFYSLS